MNKKVKPATPFGIAGEKAEDFAIGMYYTYCFTNALEELLKIEVEYELALSSSDEKAIVAKRNELFFYENLIATATTVMGSSYNKDSGSLHD